MRTVIKEMYRVEKVSKKGVKYTLYCYQLDDGTEVEMTSQYNIGERVMVWWDNVYLKPKLKRFKNEQVQKPKP